MNQVYTIAGGPFTIVSGAYINLGTCYNSQEYIITCPEPFGLIEIKQLREMNMLGYGQEYRAFPRNSEKREWIVTDHIDSSG